MCKRERASKDAQNELERSSAPAPAPAKAWQGLKFGKISLSGFGFVGFCGTWLSTRRCFSLPFPASLAHRFFWCPLSEQCISSTACSTSPILGKRMHVHDSWNRGQRTCAAHRRDYACTTLGVHFPFTYHAALEGHIL